MKFDFETRIRRFDTFSKRYDDCPRLCHGRREEFLILTAADMDFRSPPPILRALEEAAKFGIFGYSYADTPFFQPVAAWLNRRHGLTVKPEDLVSINGVISGVKMLIHACSKPGEGVIIQPPVYIPFRYGVQDCGRTVVESPLVRGADGRWTMDWDDLERRMAVSENRILLLCNPHNPVGRVWTREELGRVLEMARAHNVFVISDEIWMDMVFAPARHTSVMHFPAHAGHVALLTSAAKTFNLGGLVSGFALIPDPAVRERFQGIYRQHQNPDLHNYFSLKLMYEGYRAAESEQWLEALLAQVQANHRMLDELFAATNGKIRRTPSEGLYLAWLDLAGAGLKTRDDLCCVMERARVVGDSGSWYGPAYSPFMRLVTATPHDVMREAGERLVRALVK